MNGFPERSMCLFPKYPECKISGNKGLGFCTHLTKKTYPASTKIPTSIILKIFDTGEVVKDDLIVLSSPEPPKLDPQLHGHTGRINNAGQVVSSLSIDHVFMENDAT